METLFSITFLFLIIWALATMVKPFAKLIVFVFKIYALLFLFALLIGV